MFNCTRTLRELFSFQPFTQQLPPGSGSLKEMLEKCIALAVPKWFVILDARMLPQVVVGCVCMCLCVCV